MTRASKTKTEPTIFDTIRAEAVPIATAPAIIPSAVETSSYDYSALPTTIATDLAKIVSRIKAGHRRHIETVVEIGGDLLKAKELLGHGNFARWLEAEFRWSERTAQRFMTVAANIGTKYDTVSDLPLATVYALAADSTPVEIRQDVVRRIEGGERIDDGKVRTLVANAKKTERKAAEEAKLTPAYRKRQAALKKRRDTEYEAHRAEWKAREERQKEAASRAAEIVRERFGADLPSLLALLKECDLHEFWRALKEA